jgi:hypothetical protein
MKKQLSNPSVIVILLFLVPVNCIAQSVLDDRFSITLGAFITNRDTNTRIDSATLGTGTDIDLENDLGLDSSDAVFRVDGHYRFSQKHRVNFSIFDLSRDNTAMVQRDIQFGDQVFMLNTVVNVDFDLTIYKLAYTYSLMQRDNGYLGVTLGAYIADSKIRLAEQNLGQTEAREMTAPLPVLGLRGNYEFTDRLSLDASGEFFAVEFDNVDGSLVDLYLGVDYEFSEHVAVGVGFNSVHIDADVRKINFNGNLDWRYDGALVFFKFDF